MVRLRRLGAVGGHRPPARGADPDREHGQVLVAQRLDRGLQVPFAALAVARDQHRAAALLTLVLEGTHRGEQRGGNVRRGIAQIVGAGRVEEQPE